MGPTDDVADRPLPPIATIVSLLSLPSIIVWSLCSKHGAQHGGEDTSVHLFVGILHLSNYPTVGIVQDIARPSVWVLAKKPVLEWQLLLASSELLALDLCATKPSFHLMFHCQDLGSDLSAGDQFTVMTKLSYSLLTTLMLADDLGDKSSSTLALTSMVFIKQQHNNTSTLEFRGFETCLCGFDFSVLLI
ncbi:hypothetical protein BGZ63DRAFT_401034 [Mariannaea sp. PMI_226]|nr:hypothetical protein BGZ63DRAFT_401034 [Mariannaea sp. PMI_226]